MKSNAIKCYEIKLFDSCVTPEGSNSLSYIGLQFLQGVALYRQACIEAARRSAAARFASWLKEHAGERHSERC